MEVGVGAMTPIECRRFCLHLVRGPELARLIMSEIPLAALLSFWLVWPNGCKHVELSGLSTIPASADSHRDFNIPFNTTNTSTGCWCCLCKPASARRFTLLEVVFWLLWDAHQQGLFKKRKHVLAVQWKHLFPTSNTWLGGCRHSRFHNATIGAIPDFIATKIYHSRWQAIIKTPSWNKYILF